MTSSGSGPSPKRRRTETPATNESIAQANAMMRMMVGSKQNRWMSGDSVLTGGQPWSRREEGSSDSAPLPGDGGTGPGQSPALGQQNIVGNRQNSGPAANMAAPPAGDAITLVDYESPYNTPAPAQAASATAQTGRKSLDTRSGTPAGGQGLPSPAPSEENNVSSPRISNMPAVAPAQPFQPRRGPGRPRKDSLQTPAATISPTTPHTRTSWAAPSRRVPSVSGFVQGRSPSVQLQANAPSPLQRQQSSSQMHTLSSDASPHVAAAAYGQPSPQMPVFVPPGQSTSFVPNPAAVPNQTFAQYFDVNALCQAIAAQIQRLHGVDPAGANTRNDVARLTLLRDAVMQNDSFYLVLSQLFCLNSKRGAQKELPQSIRGVAPESWRRLGNLLCDNNSLLPISIGWFAEFPVPVMDVYSTQLEGFRTAYETQVAYVCAFLSELPREWDKLINASIKRLAPPLVQDMAGSLSLYSPILQTTAFRAIARTFWSQTKSPNQEAGIETLVSLHQQDQARYYRGLFWSPEHKKQAYVALYRVYIGWKTHDETYRNSVANSPAGAHVMPPYYIPNDILQMFGMQPAYAATGPNSTPPAPSPHQRQPSASSNAPPSFSPQQQQFIMAQNATALQNQQAWLNNAAGGGRSRQAQNGPNPVMPSQSSLPPFQHNPRSLLPAYKDCPRAQPTHPDSAKSALHQAHLRSPVLAAAEIDGVKPKLYRYVEDCVQGPERLDKDAPMQRFTFELRDDCMDKLPQTISGGTYGHRPTQSLLESSKQYRLRCCQIDMKTGFPTLGSWTEADNIWPENVMFDLNGTPLETRRKLQHGRYLPVDVTSLIKPGTNTLTVIIFRLAIDTSEFNYAVGIEVVGAVSHESLLSSIRQLSAEESLNSIKQSLSAPPDSDDEITMVSSTLTLKLFDPISGSKIFTRPVRGETCLHRDPFDLEIFLSQTQTPKNSAEGAPSTVDTWRCPICRKDVRPRSLIEDGFLVDVRRVLEKEGKLDTRAIVVEADGRWRVKAEEKTGVRSASLEREESVAARAKAKKPPVVVIELD